MGKWRDKLEGSKEAHGKICKILIPKPLDVDALVRKIPEGKLATDEQIRMQLARDNHADSTCSKVTGIFLRIIAEAAEEDKQEGEQNIAPYWRVVSKEGGLKATFPGAFATQTAYLKKEGFTLSAGKGKKPPQVKDFEHYLVNF